MDGIASLLEEAEGQGVEVHLNDDASELCIKGPKSAEPIARKLEAHRDSVIDYLKGTVEAPDSIGHAKGQTDQANAKRLLAKFGDSMRWVDEWQKWLVWDGRRWAIDKSCKVEDFAKRTAREIWTEFTTFAQDCADAKEVNRALAFCKGSNNRGRLDAMLKVARSEPGIPKISESLDCDHLKLNCLNGTLDLRTRELTPHNREDYHTKLAGVAYDPDAICIRWGRFIHEIFEGSEELQSYVRRLAGYTLIGSIDEHILPILYGTGENGKTVFLQTMLSLFGDYGYPGSSGMLTPVRNSHPTELTDLYRRRFVTTSETEQGRYLAESLVKSLTGEQYIKARRMREDFWVFEATHTVWMATNHKPRVRGQDRGIWRRLKLIPFNYCVPPEQRDPTLLDSLRDELPGILNWALDGLAEYREHGLLEPSAVTNATAEYRQEMDAIQQFIDECCEVRDDYQVTTKELFNAFQEWGGNLSHQRFVIAMADRFEKSTINTGVDRNKRCFNGLRPTS